MFNELRARLAERRISLEISDGARRSIAARGSDPVYGARPLCRFDARAVEMRIGRAVLTDAIPDGATIRVDLNGHEIVVTHDDPQPATSTAA
jgi:ATP-dependent Clp protease ATP-binding subunit ClpB